VAKRSLIKLMITIWPILDHKILSSLRRVLNRAKKGWI